MAIVDILKPDREYLHVKRHPKLATNIASCRDVTETTLQFECECPGTVACRARLGLDVGIGIKLFGSCECSHPRAQPPVNRAN
jgi:hypothetical protein